MSHFIFFNVQLLPDPKHDFIGATGYKQLFTELNEFNKEAKSKKNILEMSSKIQAKRYICFGEVRAQVQCCKGTLRMFDYVEEVKNVFNNATRHRSSGVGAQNIKENIFLFNYELHILAVEFQNLPTIEKCLQALREILAKSATNIFPEHVLTVEVLNSREQFETLLLNKERFSSAEVSVTFSNHQLFDAIEQQKLKMTEEELRENGIVQTKLTEKAASGKKMKPTERAMLLMQLAMKFGSLKAVYYDKDNNKQKFNSNESQNVIKEDVSMLGGKSLKNRGLIKRILSHITSADQKSSEG
ncbi:hypothetical protein CXF83_15175 [Shewanella sp. Choline-02u-19]|uniref:DUF4747 family protein n=1 Tax=unclassified Shewanella TaxID=196818 RepID=UPI000C3224C5|nr:MULTISPECIES: DUF4747 family protein [unclassified Shewanella]PKH56536.1 hypothetical protein CXF84_13170 [Shewanella sp. Bg11-22]PKI27958.1 hypothetical protein CXF83_15175 [Shewanella sp. Choline-02u-19]